MKIIEDWHSIDTNGCHTAVTVGKFEAVHKGHRLLLQEVASGRTRGLVPAVFTFRDARASLSDTGRLEKRFIDEGCRRELLEKLGIELLVEIEFTKAFADMTAREFISEILVKKLHAKEIVTGVDFRFGKNRMGDKKLLESLQTEYGYKYTAFDMEKYNNKNISTTYAKELLKAGEYAKLKDILGYDYPKKI